MLDDDALTFIDASGFTHTFEVEMIEAIDVGGDPLSDGGVGLMVTLDAGRRIRFIMRGVDESALHDRLEGSMSLEVNNSPAQQEIGYTRDVPEYWFASRKGPPKLSLGMRSPVDSARQLLDAIDAQFKVPGFLDEVGEQLNAYNFGTGRIQVFPGVLVYPDRVIVGSILAANDERFIAVDMNSGLRHFDAPWSCVVRIDWGWFRVLRTNRGWATLGSCFYTGSTPPHVRIAEGPLRQDELAYAFIQVEAGAEPLLNQIASKQPQFLPSGSTNVPPFVFRGVLDLKS